MITAKKHVPTKPCKVNNAWVEFKGDMWVTLEKYFTKSICEPSLLTNMYIHLNVHQTSLHPPWFITAKLNWWIKKQKHGTISLLDLYVHISNYWLFSHLLRFIHPSVCTLYKHMIYNMYLCKKIVRYLTWRHQQLQSSCIYNILIYWSISLKPKHELSCILLVNVSCSWYLILLT